LLQRLGARQQLGSGRSAIREYGLMLSETKPAMTPMPHSTGAEQQPAWDLPAPERMDADLANWLTGQPFDAGRMVQEAGLAAVLQCIDLHGIAALLADTAHSGANIPDPLQAALRERCIAQEFWEAQHARVVSEAMDILTGISVRPIMFKGSALAYSAYERPALRTRGDSDILVPEECFAAAREALTANGFSVPYGDRGMGRAATIVLSKTAPFGAAHDIDLHRQVSNSRLLGELFTHEELQHRSVPVTMAGVEIRAAGPLDALLIAAFHRLVHACSAYFVNGVAYREPDRLIWLKDIELLVARLSQDEWQQLRELAVAKGLASVLADALAAAVTHLGAQVPSGMIEDLGAAGRHEMPQRYLASGEARRLAMDFAAAPGPGAKLAFLRDLLFPPRQYLEAVVPGEHRTGMVGRYCLYLASRMTRVLRTPDTRR
jgi:hypothetical protein